MKPLYAWVSYLIYQIGQQQPPISTSLPLKRPREKSGQTFTFLPQYLITIKEYSLKYGFLDLLIDIQAPPSLPHSLGLILKIIWLFLLVFFLSSRIQINMNSSWPVMATKWGWRVGGPLWASQHRPLPPQLELSATVWVTSYSRVEGGRKRK